MPTRVRARTSRCGRPSPTTPVARPTPRRGRRSATRSPQRVETHVAIVRSFSSAAVGDTELNGTEMYGVHTAPSQYRSTGAPDGSSNHPRRNRDVPLPHGPGLYAGRWCYKLHSRTRRSGMPVVEDFLERYNAEDWVALAHCFSPRGFHRIGPYGDTIDSSSEYVAFLHAWCRLSARPTDSSSCGCSMPTARRPRSSSSTSRWTASCARRRGDRL